jgi:hypothetical protein
MSQHRSVNIFDSSHHLKESSSRQVRSQTISDDQVFVVNTLNGEISLYWASLPNTYTNYVARKGRPEKSTRVTLYHTMRYPLFTIDGVRGFISEFAKAHVQITTSHSSEIAI